jgi:hypothetical protein
MTPHLLSTVKTFPWCAQYLVDSTFCGEYITTSKTTLDDKTDEDAREKTGSCNNDLI